MKLLQIKIHDNNEIEVVGDPRGLTLREMLLACNACSKVINDLTETIVSNVEIQKGDENGNGKPRIILPK